jgi:CcmD family protein
MKWHMKMRSKSVTKVTVLFLGLLLLAVGPALARNADGASYDVQIIDSGRVVSGQEVDLRIILHSQTADGAAMYQEKHRVMTNTEGVARMVIGEGNAESGDFDQLDLATGVYFVEVQADLRGDGNYLLLSNARLLSVSRIQQWLFANEKLNTVLIIIIVIWVGIIVYLLLTGMRVSKLERELKHVQQDAGDTR